MPISLSGTQGVSASGNVVTNGVVSATGNVTGNYFIGNGSQLTGITTGNVNLTAVTTNVIPASNVTLSLGNSTNQWKDLWVSNNTIYLNSIPVSLTANNDLLVNNVPVVLSSNTAAPQTANIATTANIIAGNVVVSNATPGAGITFADGTVQTTAAGASNYGNANVADYLTTYTGNLTAGQFSTAGNVVAGGNVTANYFIGNGSLLSNINAANINGAYGNANVEAYLPSSNTIIAINANVANTNSNLANLTLVTANNTNSISQLQISTTEGVNALANTNANVANTNSNVANLTTSLANTNANVANIASNVTTLQGQVYANANVSAYLGNANTTGTIYATNINVSNTVTAATFIGNFQGNISGNLVVPGSNTWVIYNNNGNAGSDIGFTYNAATQTATVGNTISAGNILTAGLVSATGNVTGNYFIGNGSQLTGLPASYGNANVEAYLPTSNIIIGINSNVANTNGNVANLEIAQGNTNSNVSNVASNVTTLQGQVYTNANTQSFLGAGTNAIISTTGNITTTANISGNFFIGNGSQLTNLPVQTTTWANIANITGNNGPTRIAIGQDAASVSQGVDAIAIGPAAGVESQGNRSIAIGAGAGELQQGASAIAIGWVAGGSQQANNTIILNASGVDVSGTPGQANSFYVAPVRNDTSNTANVAFYNVSTKEVTYANTISLAGNITANYFIGNGSQLTNLPGANSIANGNSNVSIGSSGGNITLAVGGISTGVISNAAIGIGNGTGNAQGTNSIAIGKLAGNIAQGSNSIAIGYSAASFISSFNTVAIGQFAGNSSQLGYAIAIGSNAASITQGSNAIAIGRSAGQNTQGNNSVAIGAFAGTSAQAGNSIIINATGTDLPSVNSGFYVAPVRNDVANVGQVVFYNTSSKEVTYGNTISVSGNITAANFIGNLATPTYGSFFDTTTQTNSNVGNAIPISYNTTDINNGVTVTNGGNTQITISDTGIYNIQFSLQLAKTSGGANDIYIWLDKNGTAVANSATNLYLTGNNNKEVAAWNFVVNATAGDYYRLMWLSSSADVQISALAAAGAVPAVPSVILTVVPVGA